MGCHTSQAIDKPQYAAPKHDPLELTCKICFMNYNSRDHLPMVISCGHTICSACLKMIKAECPYDRTAFNKDKAYKNIELLQLVDEQAQIKKREQMLPATAPNMCPSKHTTIFSGFQEPCFFCENSRGGWKCSVCCISICCQCFKRKPTKKCFNNHNTSWRGIKLRCVKCLEIAYGWQCQECSYCFCTKCSETPKQTAVCPNGHPTRWANRKDIACVLCGLQEGGMCCTQCLYNICKACRPINTIVSRCPNNHRTVWTRNTVGLSCFQCMSVNSRDGFVCNQCNFFVCTLEAGWKYQNKACPNKHSSLVWKRNTVGCVNNCGSSEGFTCVDPNCTYSVCRKCLPAAPKAQTCFNQHQTKWTRELSEPCVKCLGLSHGWQCTQDCGYSLCSRCAKTPLEGIICPNTHTKLWTLRQAECLVCKQLARSGRNCEECELFVCDSCEKSDLCTSMCPNGHSLIFNQLESQCVICLEIEKCWRCKTCSFDGCIRCIKRKLNKISCPNNHPLKVSPKEQASICLRCKKYSQNFYECQKKCLPICAGCLDS